MKIVLKIVLKIIVYENCSKDCSKNCYMKILYLNFVFGAKSLDLIER